MKLLVSVRSAGEASAALGGGADLIDVKEPSRGSLGQADDATVAAVIQLVAGRKPVSAARGELLESQVSPQSNQGLPGLQYVKWGLAGCGRNGDWHALLEAAADQLPEACHPVAVAYADWQRAAAPPPADVCTFACERGRGAFLLDTWRKDGKTLLDLLSLMEIERLTRLCRDARVPVALAGSLGWRQIESLLQLAPTWFAVRGEVCREGNRTDGIDGERVRKLSVLLAQSASEGFFAGVSG